MLGKIVHVARCWGMHTWLENPDLIPTKLMRLLRKYTWTPLNPWYSRCIEDGFFTITIINRGFQVESDASSIMFRGYHIAGNFYIHP